MAAPTIPNGEEHFFTTLYEGNGAGQKVGKFVPFTDNGTIANSLIFNRADNPYMHFNKASITPDSDKIFTFSCWFKPGEQGSRLNTGIFNSNTDGSNGGNVTRYAPLLVFTAAGGIFGYDYDSGGYNWYFSTNRTFEDSSKFYHFVIAMDTTQSTSTDRMKIYIDGDQITSFSSTVYPALNQDLYTVMSGGYHILGLGYNAKFDGHIAEVNLVENQQLTPSTFGVTDTSTGRWIPKTLTGINYGTNGFRLQFGSPSNLGDDTSGNTNDFSVSNLVAGDQVTDSPTQNFATFDPLDSGNNAGATPGTAVLAEGNTRVTAPSNPSNWDQYRTSKPLLSGKYYVEVTLTSLNTATYFGVISKNQNIKGGGWYSDQKTGWTYDSSNGTIENNNSGYLSYGGARSQGDVVGIAVDLDNGKLWFSENGTYPNSGNPATGANPAFSNLEFAVQDGGLCFTEARGYSGHNDWNFGQKSYTHSAPSGFSTVQQDNMPETAKGIPAIVWIKNRDGTNSHTWQDSVRGANQMLYSDSNSQEYTVVDGVQKFLKGGCSIEDDAAVNTDANSYVAWNFVGNSGTTETNNDGETTVTLQKNTTAGLSIGTFTSKVAAQTCGHGLGVKPDFILLKRRDGSQNWMAYHSALSSTDAYYLHFNNTDQTQTGSDFNNTVPTTTVFSTNVTGTAGRTYVFYAFASVEGFSKFGKYRGNGVADGPFVYTGFKPAFIIFKAPSSSTNWYMHDAARNPFNPAKALLDANTTAAESSSYVSNGVDFLSNGFKIRQPTGYGYNYTQDIVYIAFAEHPFVGDGTNPVTAR